MLSQRIAFALNILKWPLALLSLGLLPSCFLLLYEEAVRHLFDHHESRYVVIGVLGYGIVWYCFIRNLKITFLSTLEHEITHSIFACLTFNRVVGLRATLRQGGLMTYVGHPNWLISLAPYFFPTCTVLLLLLGNFMHTLHYPWALALVGASLAYHATSTWTETHHAQTDLKDAGYLFSALILPSANLLAVAITLAILRDGSSGLIYCLQYLLHSPLNPLKLLPPQ